MTTEQIKISAAQMTALDTAGVFEAGDADGLDVIRAAISGDHISVSAEAAAALHELANAADELGRERGRHDAAMYRADSRSLTTLACKVSRAARRSIH